LIKFDLLCDIKRVDEAEQLINYCYKHARNNHNVRLTYAEFLIEQERYDEVFEMFGNHPGLDAITTDDVIFSIDNVAVLCSCYVMLWLSKDNIEEAEPYYRLLFLFASISFFANSAMLSMAFKKKQYVIEKLGITSTQNSENMVIK